MKNQKKVFKLNQEKKLTRKEKIIKLFFPNCGNQKFQSKLNFSIALTRDLTGLIYNSVFIFGAYRIAVYLIN